MNPLLHALRERAPDLQVTPLKSSARSTLFRHGAALLLVAAAAVVTHPFAREIDTTPLFYAAVFISSWYGGLGPGFLAVILSTAALNYYFSAPHYKFTPGLNDIPQLVVFAVLAALVNILTTARKRAQQALRQANDELESRVVARTAELEREIEQRKAAEATLRERADLLDLTHDTVFVRDMLDIILYWNRGAEELYGWKQEEARGRSTHELMQTVFPYSLATINRELQETGRWSGELIHTKRDGTQVVVASRWSLQRDEQGRPVRILETNNDITNWKRAEDALRRAEQLARGQSDALMRSLDVLATTPDLDHLIQPLLGTIATQLRADAVSLWLRREADDGLELRCGIEDNAGVTGKPRHPFVDDPRSWRKSPLLEEMLFTGAPAISEDTARDERIGEPWRSYLTEQGMTRLLAVPVLAGGIVCGFVTIRDRTRAPYRQDEIELAQALAHQVMLAVRMAQLAEQARHTAILEERTRMARDIHDTLAQGFTGVFMQTEAAEEALAEEEPAEAIKHIHRARELARDSLGEARRSVRALRPQALERAGFWDALRSTIRNTTLGTSLRSEFQLEGELRELPPAVEENLLQIGREALTNALKHAHATAFEIRLAFRPEAVRLELHDDGDGFVPDGANGGFGLLGMKERAEQMGGTLTVTSARGTGTTIVAVAPYQQERPA